MFESLQDGIRAAVKTLRGRGRLTEANMRDGLQRVEQALFDADVSYAVVRDFMDRVSEQAMGQKVLLALDPDQQVIKIVYDQLVELLGPVDPSLHLRKETTVLMMCGLQGSGKTTTCGKLSKLLLESTVRPMLVAADLQRPAAIDQLHVIGQQLGVPVYSDRSTTDPIKVCQDAVAKAKAEQIRVVILDTAGRLAIDQELMDQLSRIERRVEPDQVYLVVDGMTGQDAVNSAKAFNESLELDGVIMTKLDGDARGGALLSVKHVTGVPVKFIGTGEHLEALEPFRPEGMASRILGMGDVVALVQEAQRVVDESERAEMERKMAEGEFTLDDFKAQLEKFARPGLMQKMIGLIPGMGAMQQMMQGEDTDTSVRRTIGIINAMTPAERRDPGVIDPSRRNRIARGAGVQTNEVNQIVRQFQAVAPIMRSFAGKGMGERMQALQQMQQMVAQDPTGRTMPRGPKIGTGRRLSTEEKNRMRKMKEKELRKRKREERGK